MALDDYNGVRSNIIDEQTPPPEGNASRYSTFILGVAKSGEVGRPIWLRPDNVRTIYGDVPVDASFDMSLVRGYYEFVNSAKGKPDVALVRVGNVNAASIRLYENTAELSGDLAYTLVNGEAYPQESLFIRAIPEGAEYNGAIVDISEDDSGFPSYMRIDLPDGTTKGFNLSRYAGAPGVVSRVSDLVSMINSYPGFSGKIISGYVPLEKAVSLTITAASGDIPNLEYDLAPAAGVMNESWGDKLVRVDSAYVQEDVMLLGSAGALSVDFAVVPEKVMDAGTPTIDTFIRAANLETVLTVTTSYAGQSNVERTLYCARVDGWDSSYAISGNTTHDWTFALYVKRSGSSVKTELELYDAGTNPDGKYTINTSTGKVTIRETLSLGDVYYATYRYKVSYAEAKLRSDLLAGSDRSYFVYGDKVIFGAEQPADLYMYYNTKVYMEAGDVLVSDYSTATIEFNDITKLPAIGGTVTLNILYEPELPAASGKVLVGDVVQPGSLSGGKDGRLISKIEYIRVVKEALAMCDLYPRRHNIIMGMWLDEVVSGYNPETGLREDLPLNMAAEILPYIDRASNFTGECDITVPVRPLTDLSQASQSAWLTSLTENSDTELNRPANIIDSYNNFRADAPVGVFVGAIPEINSGRRYFMNPACVYTAFKAGLAYTESATNAFVPGNVLDLGVKIFNAEVIGKLNAKRYTAAAVNYKGQFVWADAPTLAIRNRSQFDRQFVRDTVYLAVNMAREVAEKYIGKPRLPQFLLSMRKDISKALDFLAPDVLSDFYVEIIPVADGYITGRTAVRMLLETAKEIRRIDIETRISLAQ